jgi:hypothetical protein
MPVHAGGHPGTGAYAVGLPGPGERSGLVYKTDWNGTGVDKHEITAVSVGDFRD